VKCASLHSIRASCNGARSPCKAAASSRKQPQAAASSRKQPQAAASSRKQPQAAAPRKPTPTINTALVLQIEQSPEVNPVSHKQPNTLSASQLVYSWNNTEPAVAPATSAKEGKRVPTNEGENSEAQSSGVLFKFVVCVCACV
jgi:hypothetical protein